MRDAESERLLLISDRKIFLDEDVFIVQNEVRRFESGEEKIFTESDEEKENGSERIHDNERANKVQ